MANITNIALDRLYGKAPTLSPAASLYAKKEEEEKKNKGGLLGGIGYLAHKLGLGFLQGIEGVWDYAAGGIADLFGGDDWAKDQFESDWFNYNAADDWFDPGEGWKVAGDVAGGMGTSLPGMLTAAGLTIATGGTAAPAALGLLVGSLSAAGTSTKEAMQQSGELTGKEYLYGAGMGAVEAVTEKLSGGLGTGITKAAKSVGKAFGKVAAKETAEAAVKSAAKKGVALSLKTAAKQAGKEFASEAFEEGFSEWIAPYIARVTYDPSAENATPGQILYSALIGGLSGVGMAGTTGAFVQYKNYRSGKSIEGESRAQQIIDLARIYTDETASNAEEAVGIRELYAKLASDVESGAALSTEQKRKLGELNAFETAVQLSPMVQRSAIGVIGSADAVAERLNAAGRYKIVDGRLTDTQSTKVEEGATVRDITAEDIRGKYDAKNKGSLAKELRKNDVLRYLAASDAAGRLMMGAEDVEKAILSGTPIQSQADLNEFITKASAEKKAAVGKELGIEDWNTLTVQELANKASAYRESGKAEAYVRKTENIKKMREIESTKARNIPRAIALADGAAAHYADADSDFAIARSGDTFTVYDYTTGNVTRELTRAEVNAELARYRERKRASTVQERATSETANATSEKTSENFSSDAKNEIKDEKISKTAFENEFSEEKAAPTTNSRRITADMTENERYEALKGRMLENIPATSAISESVVDKIPEISSWEDLNTQFGKKKRSIIQTLAKEFGAFDKEYFNDDIKLSFEFSGNNYRESYNKQGKNYIDFAKMFSVFDSVVENAVGIEVHKRTDYKTDPTLENVFVLMSAYQDADSIIPVKLEVKKFKDKKNTLYVAISLNKIKKTEVLKQGNTENGVTQNSRSVTISIAKIFEKINPSDKSFLKYIPDGFLNEEQKKAKREAIEADKRKSTKKAFESEFSEEKSRPTVKQIKEAAEARRQDAEIEALAKEKIKDYEDLSKPNQSMIRKVLREARAKGLSDADALSYARVSARSGLDIVFDKKACYKGKNEAGEDVYHAGYYDPENNRIVVNPETERKHASLLIHELSHALRAYRGNDGKRHAVPMIYDPGKISDEMWKRIENYYADQEIVVERAELMADEASSYYAEKILGTDAAIELLLGEKPTLRQKILSFFKQSARDYSADAALSREARRLLRDYKALFDLFSARNQGRNVEAGNVKDRQGRRFAADYQTAKINANILNLISKVKSKQYKDNENVELNPPSKEVLNELQKITGIDFSDYKVVVEARQINHILRDHGENGRTDQSMKDIQDIAKIEYALSSPDSIEKAGKTQAYSYMRNGYNRTADTVRYEKKIGEKSYYVIQALPVANKKTLYIVSAFIGESGYKKGTSQLIDANSPNATAEHGSVVVPNNSIPDSTEKSNPSDENSSKKSSESGKRASMDSDYMSAVERGDMVTAQRMVNEAAREAGYAINAYHGTPNMEFTIFDKDRVGKGNDQYGSGFYFATDKEAASHYGNRVINAVLSIKKPIKINANTDVNNLIQAEIVLTKKQAYEVVKRLPNIYDSEESPLGDYFDAYWEDGAKDWMIRELAEQYRDVGLLDSDLFRNYPNELHEALYDVVGYDGVEVTFEKNGEKFYVAWFDNQIKSADPVTYDDNGNVIPLSERFNPKKSDIRYSMDLDESNMDIDSMTEEQYNSFGWARESKAITKKELDDLYSKVNAKQTLRSFKRSSRGEAIVEVNDDPNRTLGTNNVFVFLKGTKDNFEILRIVRFNAQTEAEMDNIKESFYEGRTSSNTYLEILKGEGLAREYRREDSPAFTSYREGRSNRKTSRGANKDNRGPVKYGSGYSLTVGEDGEIIETSRRYSMDLDETDEEPKLPRTAGTMSTGQHKKRIADLTKAKSYSKDQIYDIVKKLPMADMAMEKTREQVAEAIWQIYNEQLTANERREAAHDIAQFLVARLLTEAKTENPDATEANEAMAYLRTGIGRLAFSEADRAELLHNLDKDGWRRILGRWGFKGKRNADGTLQGVRTPMEVFVTDIAREMPGMEHLEQMHPVEAFLEIDSYYSRVKEEAAEKKTSAFLYMSDEDIDSLAKSIEESIVDAYNQGGGKSIFIKRIEQGVSYYEQRAAKYREEFNEIRGRDKIHGLLMDQTQKMRDLKLRRFANITDGANETFKNIIKTLSSLQYRGNLSVTNAKKAIKDLYVWYTSKEVKENLFGFTDEDPGTWQQGVAEMLEELANDENKGFSKAELRALLDVLSYFTHFVENFGKVWHHGEWVDAKELATGFIQVAQNQSKVKHRFVRDLLRKYMQFFGDPAAVVRLMDQYQDGFFTQIYDDLRDAAISASYAERDILAAYDAFLKDHKRYVETASKETVQYRGVDIPKMHLIGLYMTMKRKHAHAGYAINGFSFKDAKGDTVRVRGSLDPDTVYTQQEIEDYVARERIKIEALLSDADKQYISILEKVYNEDAKRLKSDRDIQRFGMTNAANDYYYPIRRANAAQKLDADMQMEIDRVSSASFNKDTVAGAKQELFIESADSLFLRHVHVVCQYAYLTPVLDMQKMLYNLDISGNKNHPISIHTESQNIWPDGFKYFRELVSDVQGIPRTSSAGTRFLSALRGNYAKFQLGANPKTWLTQLSSLLASTSLLDASSVVKGLGMRSDGFTEYSKLAKLRAEDNAAAKAQGVLDNNLKRTTDTIGDALMAPIGMMDKFVVGRLFAACQVQIEKDGGAKIGSEENKIEAGKLLTRVILETQQNSLATEKSAAMRSGNEFYRSLTMFRSDSMKVIGRVIDGFGEVSAVSGMLKSKTMDEDSRKSLEARLAKAKKKTAKASVSLILSAVFMALIAQGFRWLYAKDKEEDETFAKTMLVDSLGNMIGGLPGFADVYTKLVEGYDVGNYSYSAINDVLSSAKNIFDIAEGIITGEGTAQERMRGIRNASYSLGQLLGIPTRNAYNLLYGLTKRVSPGTGYKIDSAFYEKNFKTDLEKAIEKGDDKMAMLTLQLLLGERMGEDIDEAVFDELLSLSKKGMKVLPRVTPESITVNGETFEFTEDEKAAVADIYEQRNEGLGSLFASSAYKAMTDADKEKAVSVLYDLYYDKALSEALGVDRGNALLFANAIGYGKYAAFKTRISGIASDKDKDGNTVAGSKRAKVVKAIGAMNLSREEKLLLIASSGYSLQDGEIRGISAASAKRMLLKYILSMKGTQAEKAALAEACGFEVKNGKILRNSL